MLKLLLSFSLRLVSDAFFSAMSRWHEWPIEGNREAAQACIVAFNGDGWPGAHIELSMGGHKENLS
jgi:hypothetical protein